MSDTVGGGVDVTAGSQKRTLLGHPIGLAILFLTEMWERFSFYGMRAILILYLTKHFLFSAEDASLIYGAYIGLVYLLPILGGYVSDRYLGSRKAVTYGALLLVAGHVSLAFEGPEAVLVGEAVERSDFYISIFYLSLALIITGVGFLKANISTIVGTLYGDNDPRRDSGFTIFYMGINLGSVTSIAAVGYVGEVYGWNYGFGLAGIGMIVGLLIFLWGQKFLEGRAEPPNLAELKEKVFGPLDREHLVYIAGIGLVGLMWVMLNYQEVVGQLLGITGIVMLAIILIYGFTKCEPFERDRLMVASFLIATQSVFWALFEQQGASLTLLADQQFDLTLPFGITVLASQVQLLNPAFVFTLGPIFAWMWVALARKNLEPTTPAKFGIAMLLIGLGYIFFAYGVGLTDTAGKSFLWMIVIYFFLTSAELCLSPVGLSMVTKLSVARIVGMVMGTFFLFISLGNYLAGIISSLTGGGAHGGDAALLSVPGTIEVYNGVGLLAIGVGVFLLLLTPLLKKGMHGVH